MAEMITYQAVENFNCLVLRSRGRRWDSDHSDYLLYCTVTHSLSPVTHYCHDAQLGVMTIFFVFELAVTESMTSKNSS